MRSNARALTIGAKYDEMDPEDMKKMATLMPNASSFICQQASHLCMWDDQAFTSSMNFGNPTAGTGGQRPPKQ